MASLLELQRWQEEFDSLMHLRRRIIPPETMILNEEDFVFLERDCGISTKGMLLREVG